MFQKSRGRGDEGEGLRARARAGWPGVHVVYPLYKYVRDGALHGVWGMLTKQLLHRIRCGLRLDRLALVLVRRPRSLVAGARAVDHQFTARTWGGGGRRAGHAKLLEIER